MVLHVYNPSSKSRGRRVTSSRSENAEKKASALYHSNTYNYYLSMEKHKKLKLGLMHGTGLKSQQLGRLKVQD